MIGKFQMILNVDAVKRKEVKQKVASGIGIIALALMPVVGGFAVRKYQEGFPPPTTFAQPRISDILWLMCEQSLADSPVSTIESPATPE